MSYPKVALVWNQHRTGRNVVHTLVQMTRFVDGATNLKGTRFTITKFNGWYCVQRSATHIGQELRLNKAKALAEATFILGE